MSEQKQCAYCHAKLFEDDDVVFCPECGAPHHRDCYNTLGHCAREQFHGTEEPEEEMPKSDGPREARPDGIPSDREGRICSKCGSISSSDTLFCPYCGTPFNQSEPPADNSRPVPPPFVVPGVNPYGGVDPSGEIEGVPVSEMAIHVRANSHHYLPIFDKLAKAKKNISFNWSAFFFSYAWLFYRKCYFAGLVSILFTVVGYILTAPYCVTMLRIMEQNGITGINQNVSQQMYNLVAQETVAAMEPFGWIMLAAAVVLIFIIHLAVGIFANRIYLNKCKNKIGKIKADESVEDKISAIAASGGANIISSALILYTMLYFVFNNVIILFY